MDCLKGFQDGSIGVGAATDGGYDGQGCLCGFRYCQDPETQGELFVPLQAATLSPTRKTLIGGTRTLRTMMLRAMMRRCGRSWRRSIWSHTIRDSQVQFIAQCIERRVQLHSHANAAEDLDLHLPCVLSWKESSIRTLNCHSCKMLMKLWVIEAVMRQFWLQVLNILPQRRAQFWFQS